LYIQNWGHIFNFQKNDPLSLDNYRPITLLNTDTKILAYTIAQRLKEVLPSIIHSDQKGRIHPFISVYIVQIHLINELLKPNFSRHSVINDHSKESNAFVKSRNNMAPSMLNFSE
jgi:hypothetical protein